MHKEWVPVDLEKAYAEYLDDVLVFMRDRDVVLDYDDPADNSRGMIVDGEVWIDYEAMVDLWRAGMILDLGGWRYTLNDDGRREVVAILARREAASRVA